MMMKKTAPKKKMADGGYATDEQGNKLFVSRPAAASTAMPVAATAAPAVNARRRRGRIGGLDPEETRIKRDEKRAQRGTKHMPASKTSSTAPTTMMAKGGMAKKAKKK